VHHLTHLPLCCFLRELPVPANALLVSGTYIGQSNLTPSGLPGVLLQNFTGDGDDTTFGTFTLTDESKLDIGSPPIDQITNLSFSIAFADGILFGNGSGTGTDIAPGVVSTSLDLAIIGGTGRFAGETGKVTATEIDTLSGPTTLSVTDGSYTGTLSAVPEPATWAMLLIGFFSVGAMARYARSRRRTRSCNSARMITRRLPQRSLALHEFD
jgi:hypothetical protein